MIWQRRTVLGEARRSADIFEEILVGIDLSRLFMQVNAEARSVQRP